MSSIFWETFAGSTHSPVSDTNKQKIEKKKLKFSYSILWLQLPLFRKLQASQKTGNSFAQKA